MPEEYLSCVASEERLRLPDPVQVKRFRMRRTVMSDRDERMTGGFVTNVRPDKQDKQYTISRQEYAAEGKQMSDAWAGDGDVRQLDTIMERHEAWLQRLIKDRQVHTYHYAMSDEDITRGKGTVAVSKIKNLLRDAVKKKWIKKTGGVTDAWLYHSMTGCPFSLHPEDFDLLSFNVNLSHGVKVWLCILPESRELIERRVKQLYPSTCADVMRHKMFYFPRQFLDTLGVRYIIIAQTRGRVMLTLPNCLHQGFNISPSVHVAVNMASIKWIPFGLLSSEASSSWHDGRTHTCLQCTCDGNKATVVRLPMEPFVRAYYPNFLIEKGQSKLIPITTYKLVSWQKMMGNHGKRRVKKAAQAIRREAKQRRKEHRNRYHCCFSACPVTVSQKASLRRHYTHKHKDEDLQEALAKTGKHLTCTSDTGTGSCILCDKRLRQ